MRNDKITDIRQLLIGFSRLSSPQKAHFLETLNTFMFASPQCRRKLMHDWQQPAARPPATARRGQPR